MNTTNDSPEIKIVETGSEDGQNKCPKCGATCIALNTGAGRLRCNFCRHEFEPERAIGLDTDLSQLEGKVVGSGTQNIAADSEDIVTLKCASCGAEVVIDTNESAQARCHWCRNTLSINGQIPNGSIPDMVLPFSVTQDEAQAEIEQFVKKRRFFAHPKFKEEFCTDNIMGVYLPYMVVGINSQATFAGQGERLIRRYTVSTGTGKNRRTTTYYDADLYDVERKFDMTIDGLTIISSSDKLDTDAGRTNNIINAIKPFDNENCVKWNANYLRGFASEKRDTNIDDLKGPVVTKAKDIARHNANDTIKQYDRGVRWSQEQLDIKGQQWKAAYLPIWLYSYQQLLSGGRQLLHYVAVNARTKKTMGSVPVNKPKLLGFAAIAQVIGLLLAFLSLFSFDEYGEFGLIFALSGVAYYLFFYLKYRNVNARFQHEKDTKTNVTNVQPTDRLVRRLKGLRNARMQGANNTGVDYKAGGGILGAVNTSDLSGTMSSLKDKFNDL
ncbi:MAG: TFIIB-type zinc ribbon-containing protein [Oscillospiraceae bacterium]|nr:TFIIB-type zinc ribbon-containing protein [Oscillospiraceae bacterium]